MHVALSITTLDAELARDMEPRTSSPAARFRAAGTLADAGVPVRVMTAPIIAGLNDHEIPALLAAAKDAGATSVGYTVLRLPGAVEPVFFDWLSRVRPEAESRVRSGIAKLRGGATNDSRFGHRMRGTGLAADTISMLFKTFAAKHQLTVESVPLRTDLFVPPVNRQGQLSLF